MAVTGKTGADAIFIALKHICRVITSYNLKLRAVVVTATGAGAITAGQRDKILAFIDDASIVCSAFDALAAFSGF